MSSLVQNLCTGSVPTANIAVYHTTGNLKFKGEKICIVGRKYFVEKIFAECMLN